MKASDLRIGNIIKDDRKAKDWRFVTHRIISDLASNPNIELYHQVPLSEEWLKRFGFEKHGPPQCNSTYWTVKHIVDVFWEDGRFVNGIDREIKYVHQLQNLYFALTGEELTIKE
jgi:hypothetical protein